MSTTTTTDFSDKLAAYERSCGLGTDWLLGQMNAEPHRRGQHPRYG